MASISKKITILDIFATLTFLLMSIVGYLNIATQNRIIAGQDRLVTSQDEMRKEQSNTNAFMQVHTSQISNLIDDVSEVKITQKKFKKEILIRVDGISERVYKLEGAK